MIDSTSPRRRRPDTSDLPDAREVESTWDRLGAFVPAPDSMETDAAWEALSARLFAESAPATTASPPSTGREAVSTRRRWRVPASIAAAAAAATLFSLAPAGESARPGEIARVTLAAGSTVELAPGSRVFWRRGFSWIPGVPAGDRVVRLDGEAFFDVTRVGREFRVETRDAVVTVLGTRFNVRSHDGDPTRVTVEEGRVAVSDRADGSRIELTAGERGGPFGVDGRLVRQIAPEFDDLVWRHGGISLEDATLDRILDEVRRRFAADVRLVDADLAELRLTLHYDETVDARTLLGDVAAALDLELRSVDDGWEIRRE